MKGGSLQIQDVHLSENQSRFLSNIVSSLQKEIGDKLLSIILFGSVVKGGFTKGISDFDMIIIVDDSMSCERIHSLDSKVQSLSEKHRIVSSATEEFQGIPQFIMAQTGMFKSHFICRRTEFVKGKFTRIFQASPLLAKLISPSRMVLGGVLKGSRTVYGEDLISEVEVPALTNLDVMKSLFMNEVLVGLSLFYYPFTENATKLAMEATKWSLHAGGHLATGKSMALEDAVEVLARRGVSLNHVKRLERLRGDYQRDFSFVLSAPKAIAGIHLSLLEGPREYH